MEKAYETYKDSGVEWIGKIPENWKSVSLKWISNITKGRKPKVDYDESGENLLPYLSMEFLRDKTSNPTYASIDEKGLVFVDDGDILILWDGSKAGEIVKAKKGALSSTMAKIDITDSDFESTYLNYLLQLGEKHIQENTIGMGIPHVSGDVLKGLKMLLPPKQEQTQIAAYLDYHTQLIDTLISKKETLIKKLQEQRQAIINEAVTKGISNNGSSSVVELKESGIEWLGEIPEHWEVVKFRYKFETSKGLTITKANLQDEGVPCVNYGEIHSKYGFEVNPEIHNLKCVSEEYLNTNESSLLSKGDFVFADTSEDIEGSGNFTHLHSDIPTFAGYHTIIARLVDNSNYRFFAYFFDSSTFRTQIQNLVKGVKVFSITNKILKDTDLLFPPIEEQNQIADFIDVKIDKIFVSSEKLKTSIQKLKEYRQSLISEAVTGKIDVRDWQEPNNN
ncbi:restriction endonuclease subunit S [Pontimicrobium sp. MEBiC06410]